MNQVSSFAILNYYIISGIWFHIKLNESPNLDKWEKEQQKRCISNFFNRLSSLLYLFYNKIKCKPLNYLTQHHLKIALFINYLLFWWVIYTYIHTYTYRHITNLIDLHAKITRKKSNDSYKLHIFIIYIIFIINIHSRLCKHQQYYM